MPAGQAIERRFYPRSGKSACHGRHLRHGLRQGAGIDVAQYQGCTCRRQGARHSLAQVAGSAGDEGDAAGEG